jgi:hypothetical protein
MIEPKAPATAAAPPAPREIPRRVALRIALGKKGHPLDRPHPKEGKALPMNLPEAPVRGSDLMRVVGSVQSARQGRKMAFQTHPNRKGLERQLGNPVAMEQLIKGGENPKLRRGKQEGAIRRALGSNRRRSPSDPTPKPGDDYAVPPIRINQMDKKGRSQGPVVPMKVEIDDELVQRFPGVNEVDPNDTLTEMLSQAAEPEYLAMRQKSGAYENDPKVGAAIRNKILEGWKEQGLVRYVVRPEGDVARRLAAVSGDWEEGTKVAQDVIRDVLKQSSQPMEDLKYLMEQHPQLMRLAENRGLWTIGDMKEKWRDAKASMDPEAWKGLRSRLGKRAEVKMAGERSPYAPATGTGKTAKLEGPMSPDQKAEDIMRLGLISKAHSIRKEGRGGVREWLNDTDKKKTIINRVLAPSNYESRAAEAARTAASTRTASESGGLKGRLKSINDWNLKISQEVEKRGLTGDAKRAFEAQMAKERQQQLMGLSAKRAEQRQRAIDETIPPDATHLGRPIPGAFVAKPGDEKDVWMTVLTEGGKKKKVPVRGLSEQGAMGLESTIRTDVKGGKGGNVGLQLQGDLQGRIDRLKEILDKSKIPGLGTLGKSEEMSQLQELLGKLRAGRVDEDPRLFKLFQLMGYKVQGNKVIARPTMKDL